MTRSDVLDRIKLSLPSAWFQDLVTNLETVFSGFCAHVVFVYDLIGGLRLLTRIKTTTGGFLELVAGDFFGESLPRMVGETDSIYCTRILANLFREKATLSALNAALSTAFTDSDITFVVSEYDPTSPIVIPAVSIPVGLALDAAAARYGTDIGPFETLVRITGLSISNETIDLESGGPIQLEGGGTLDMESINYSQYQYLLDIISSVKPIGTIVWVSYTP